LSSVSDFIAQTIVFHDAAISAWIDLKERFAKVDRVRISTLHSTINNLKQGTKSVLEYFLELRTFWDELNSHRPIPNCTCVHQCRCDSIRLAKHCRVEDQILQFLIGFNESFSVVKTQILLMEALPPINKVYSLVVQEESQNALLPSPISVDESSISVNAYDSRKYAGNKGKGFSGNCGKKVGGRFCTFCNRYNHTIEFFYQKHGHPSFNKVNSSSHVANAETSDASKPAISSDVVAAGSNFSLTQEKFDHLVSLLQQANLLSSTSPPSRPISNHINTTSLGHSPGATSQTGIYSVISCSLQTNSEYWLLGSGANDHICCSLSSFSSFYKIKPVNVNLPNSTSVLAHHAGNIQFSRNLFLTHVLYSPTFKLNLISISKLCDSLSCYVQFSSNSCAIQDLSTQKMIDLGEKLNGLYRLVVNASASSHPHLFPINKIPSTICNSASSLVSPVHNSNVIPASALWHFRLGHLSHQRLVFMQTLYPSISCDNKAICDVCHFARHKKSSFVPSISHATSKFELLHFDIWGPLAISSVHNHKYCLTIVDDFSRFVWTILLKTKAEVSHHVKQFIIMIENQYNIVPKTVRSDNGPEFLIPDYYASKGILHQKSCVETPQQNGRVERKHQHSLNVAHALLFQI